jgi:uncharacterized membrane protein
MESVMLTNTSPTSRLVQALRLAAIACALAALFIEQEAR